MSHCLLIKDEIVNEGDTIEITIEGITLDSIKMKVLEINPESQSFKATLGDNKNSIFDIPVGDWLSASIIKKEDPSNPNIKFKRRNYHRDAI
jgi:hypothetical protein